MATIATDIRQRDVIRLGGIAYKVQSVNLHTGGGKTGAMVHIKIRNLETGHVNEHRFAPTEKLDKLNMERVPMQYLYNEGDEMVFMNLTTYEQYRLHRLSVGPASSLLKEEDVITMELFENKPLTIDFPDTVELKVIRAGSGIRGDTTFKEAELDNGLTILAPQFIKEGDRVRISVETREYVDRAHEKIEKPVFAPNTKKSEKGGA